MSVSKILDYNCFPSSPRGYKWVPAREEVDIVFEKIFGREMRKNKELLLAQLPGANIKRIETVIVHVKCTFQKQLSIIGICRNTFNHF